jgi:hypothetical protein
MFQVVQQVTAPRLLGTLSHGFGLHSHHNVLLNMTFRRHVVMVWCQLNLMLDKQEFSLNMPQKTKNESLTCY